MMIRYFLYYMLMAGIVWDGNPNGALRAIKEIEKSKQIIEGKKDEIWQISRAIRVAPK